MALDEILKVRRKEQFRKDLAELINRHSMENESNTPDYMLADYLIRCLNALEQTINDRRMWMRASEAPEPFIDED